MRWACAGWAAVWAVCGAGCSGGGGEGARGGPDDNVLRVNLGAEVQDLDPHLVTGIPEHRALSSMFEGLADLDPKTMQPVPAAADSWTVSPDGLVYTFRIRAGAKWSNGEPLTAHDFVYGYRRMLSPALGAEYAYLLHVLKNGKAFNEGAVTDFAAVGAKALDDATLELTLEHPAPYLLAEQIHQAWYPVHRATIERFGRMDERGTPWTRAGNHVSNGPFRLVEWSPGERIRVARNEHHWDAASVRLAGIEFTPISNLQTEERSFRSGALHMTETVPLHKIEVYKRENPESIVLGPYYASYYYRLNTTKPPFGDKRVRQAFAMALDRDTLAATVLKAGERPAASYVPPDVAGYTPTAQVPFDPARAQALLAEAGYPGGQGLPPVEILYNTSEAHQTIAEAVQAMWRKHLGAEVTLVNQDWKVYLSTMDTLDYQVARSGWVADVLDPITFLECFLSYSGNNRTGFDRPEYDALIAHVKATADPAQRIALMQQAEAMLLDELPFVPIYFYTLKFLMGPEVKGYTPNVLDYRRWKDLWLEGAAPPAAAN